MESILKLSTGELVALDRVLGQIREAIREKKRSTTISLTNRYFVEMILEVAKKRVLSEEEIKALTEGFKEV